MECVTVSKGRGKGEVKENSNSGEKKILGR